MSVEELEALNAREREALADALALQIQRRVPEYQGWVLPWERWKAETAAAPDPKAEGS